MNVIWTREALNNVKEIYMFHKQNVSIKVANALKKKIFTSVKLIEKYTRKGQIEPLLANHKDEFRYIVKGNYKIIYKIN